MRFRKPSPSMAVSLTALTVAMGGTSYAAVKITSANIKNQTIQSKDIGKGGVGKSEVRNQSLESTDLAKGSVGASEVRNGSLGPADFKKGFAGPTGPTGPAGTGRWVLVNAAGAIEAQSGGFTSAGYQGDNVVLDANEPLDDNGVVASIAFQNGNASGQISASRCAIASTVTCPTGTDDAEHIIVAPRNADGAAPATANRKRFYVVVSGDSSDVHAPN